MSLLLIQSVIQGLKIAKEFVKALELNYGSSWRSKYLSQMSTVRVRVHVRVRVCVRGGWEKE